MKKPIYLLLAAQTLIQAEIPRKETVTKAPPSKSLTEKIAGYLPKDGAGSISILGATALKTFYYHASEKGLFDADVMTDSLDDLVIHCINKHTFPETMNVLLDLGANPNANTNPLNEAVKKQKATFVKPLIEAGASPHAVDQTIIHTIIVDRPAIAALLIEHGIAFKYEQFAAAMQSKNTPILTAFKKCNATQFDLWNQEYLNAKQAAEKKHKESTERHEDEEDEEFSENSNTCLATLLKSPHDEKTYCTCNQSETPQEPTQSWSNWINWVTWGYLGK